MGNESGDHPEHIFNPRNHILRESLGSELFEKNKIFLKFYVPAEISASKVNTFHRQKIDFLKNDEFSHFDAKNHFFWPKIHKKFIFLFFYAFSFQKKIFAIFYPIRHF